MSLEALHQWRRGLWQWFVARAQGQHALAWLALVSFIDPIFFPVAPEIYLVALMLARPGLWRQYLPVSILFSVFGASVGYVIGGFLFHTFGLPILQFYHLEKVFLDAQHLVHGHVFWGMIVIAFSPIPEKVAVLAAGFLGVHFIPFILGFFVGRGVRLALVVYFTQAYGEGIIRFLSRYFKYFLLLCVILGVLYATLHWHLLPIPS
jgi:membrane protein YqaA with SNARE-associated domain